MRHVLFLLIATATLTGCPRPIPGDDAGMGEPDAGPMQDAAYHLPQGNEYAGPILLDDRRVENLDPTALRAGASPCRAPILARVTSVTDGDTITIIGVSEAVSFRVRMIGVDTPEVGFGGNPSECYGREASEFTNQLYERLVWLTFDNDCQDNFDRYLAYVHVGAGEGDLWERQLLQRGYASVLTIGANRAYAPTFMGDENIAFDADVGMWGACP